MRATNLSVQVDGDAAVLLEGSERLPPPAEDARPGLLGHLPDLDARELRGPAPELRRE